MAFFAPSDRIVSLAWAVGLAALAATVALALAVLWMRQRRLVRERRREQVVSAWRPILIECVLGGEAPLGALSPRDEDAFLLLWNQLQEGLRGEARERLSRLAERMGAHEMACARLRRGDALGRLLALNTLGHLGRASDFGELLRSLDDPQPYVCLAAARALVHLDGASAPREILPRLAAREDWPAPLFATALAEADRTRLAAALGELQPHLAPRQHVRLIPLVSVLETAEAEALLRVPLAAPAGADALAAGLERVRSPSLLHLVRSACNHESWAVRAQAAAALGRVGEATDRDALERLVVHPEWWVRYRAAQALTSGRFGAPAEAAARVARLGDRFARDIIEHALAEA